MLTILSGLAAGTVHVVAGPDHLVAVAPIAAHDPDRATQLGFRWGLGHGAGAVALGTLGVLTRDALDLEALSAWAEFSVGFVLVALGVWSWNLARQTVVHVHEHDHDGDAHQHVHVHAPTGTHDDASHSAHTHTAFAVGMLHGAAGTGHLLAVLPSLALPAEQAAVYLSAYFVAAVGSMTAFGGFLGKLVPSDPRRLRWALYGASSSAVAVGVFWVGQTWPL